MYFDALSDESTDSIWDKIMTVIGPELAQKVCPNASTFISTSDGLECNIRNAKGDILGNCYSENNRMDGRRWTIRWISVERKWYVIEDFHYSFDFDQGILGGQGQLIYL